MTHSAKSGFCSIGLSYKKADTQKRGELAFFPEQINAFIAYLQPKGIESFFVVSTCNRTEIYAFCPDPMQLAKAYCRFQNVHPQEAENLFVVRDATETINHLFRVASGLESQILGDFEIVSQIRIWAKRFKKKGCLNAFLERMVNTAIEISKKIKTQTELSSGTASVSFAAVQYILQHTQNSLNKNITLFGTGKIGANTCENLLKFIPKEQLTLVNRTQEKAEQLAEKLGLQARPMDELKNLLTTTDVLVVATAAPNPTITAEHIPKDKNLLILDLSIPENVLPCLRLYSQLEIVNVDELSRVVNETLANRKNEIPKAEAIILRAQMEFDDWCTTREFAPAIQAFRDKLTFLQNHELRNLKKKDPSINGKETQLAEKLVQKLTNRFASHLLENQEEADKAIDWVERIFKLEDSE